MAGFNTVKTYALDGTTKAFNITFDYLARQHIVVSIVKSDGTRQVLALGTDYRFTTATAIETTLAWGSTANPGVSIELKRQTPADKAIVNFQDGSILRSADLNLSNIQSIYIAEEARELANEGIGIDINGQLDARNRRIINVADAIADTDAANLGQVKKLTGDAAGTAGGYANDAAASARAAAASAAAASNSERNAANSEQNALNSENLAKQHETDAETAQTAAETAESNAQTYNNQAANFSQNASTSAQTASQSSIVATQQAVNAATSATDAASQYAKAKQEADRAKLEADKIAGQNQLTNAISGVGSSPDYIVDFKSMPTVAGTPITQALNAGGLQVNSSDVCGNDDTVATDNLDANQWSGKNFLVKKGTLNTAGTARNNKTPVGMFYDQAICVDVYGTWTPAGGTEGKTRVQTIFDRDVSWVRGYHNEDKTWTPWKKVITQLLTDATGLDFDTLTGNGFYTFTSATNAPVIDSPEDSSVYFLTINSDDDNEQVVQNVQSFKTNSKFTRYRIGGTWSRWWNDTATWDVDTAPAGFDFDTNVNPGLWGVDLTSAVNGPASLKTGKVILEIVATADGAAMQTLKDAERGQTWLRGRGADGIWRAWKDYTVVHEDGRNDSIQKLTALSGPLTLGAPGSGPNDAITLTQLQSATGQNTGATMNGVMNTYLGAVEWFNGDRAKLPAGYVAADGQLLSRTDYPEMWTAVKSSFFALCGSTDGTYRGRDSDWVSIRSSRGCYSYGKIDNTSGDAITNNGTTTDGVSFRIPDLNGVQTGSIRGLFLRGDGMKGLNNNETGNGVGVVRDSAIQNINGNLSLGGSTGLVSNQNSTATNAFRATGGNKTSGVQYNTNLQSRDLGFDANQMTTGGNGDGTTGGSVYRNGTTEVRPNSVQGIWIIRVKGSFETVDTNFHVIKDVATVPAANFTDVGGEIVSDYRVAGSVVGSTTLRHVSKYGVSGYPQLVSTFKANPTANPVNHTYNFPSYNGTSADVVVSVNGTTTVNKLTSTGAAVLNSLTVNNGCLVNGGFRVNNDFANEKTYPSELNHNGGVFFSRVRTTGDAERGAMLMYASIDGTGRRMGHIDVSQDGKDSVGWTVLRNDGSFNCPGPVYSNGNPLTSDRNQKHDIVKIEDALSKVEKLNGYTFKTNLDNRPSAGVIAQEVQEVLPEVVGKANLDDHLTVEYAGLIGLLVEAVKELKAEVETLKAKA